MKKDSVEQQIKDDWFKDHVAEFEKLSDRVSTLTWSNQSSSSYFVRYVFDGSKLYVSGDTGEAVFCLTEKADLKSIQRYDIQYFHGKMSALCEEKYSFDSATAILGIREHIKYANENKDFIDDDGTEDDTNRNRKINNYITYLYDLINESDSCMNKSSWGYAVNQVYDNLTDYDSDVCEWIFSVGDVIPMCVQGFLIGLKMACEQLNNKAVSA